MIFSSKSNRFEDKTNIFFKNKQIYGHKNINLFLYEQNGQIEIYDFRVYSEVFIFLNGQTDAKNENPFYEFLSSLSCERNSESYMRKLNSEEWCDFLFHRKSHKPKF